MSIDDDLFGPDESDGDERKAQRREDLLAVLGLASGCRVLARLVANSGVLLPVHNELTEGGRRIGLALLADIEAADPDLYRALMMEVLNVR